MKILIILVLAIWPVASSAYFLPLTPSQRVKAQIINDNFKYIEESLAEKNTRLSFTTFEEGEIIEKEKFEAEFDKVRALGISVTPIVSLKIKAEELNRAFLEMIEGSVAYNDTPVASDSFFEIDEDTILSDSLDFTNVVGPTIFELISSPQHGSVVFSGKQFTYTPNTNYFGNDFFTYKVSDGEKTSSLATVSLSIRAINDAPIIVPQNVTMYETVEQSINLEASDIEGSPLTYSIVTPPSRGVLSGTAPHFTYLAGIGAAGADYFTIKVRDGELESALVTININVLARNTIVKGASYRSYSDGTGANSCAQYLSNPDPRYLYSGDTGNGVYLIDPDGGSPSNAYSEYCNFTLGGTNINNVRFELRSSGWNQGATYVSLNNSTIAASYGRGWTVVAFNKNMEHISSANFDTYSGAAYVNNFINHLNSLPNGTIVALVTADEPQSNFSAAAWTAVGKYGCSSVGLAYRSAYLCLGMKTTTGAARLLGGPAYNTSVTVQSYLINWKNYIGPY